MSFGNGFLLFSLSCARGVTSRRGRKRGRVSIVIVLRGTSRYLVVPVAVRNLNWMFLCMNHFSRKIFFSCGISPLVRDSETFQIRHQFTLRCMSRVSLRLIVFSRRNDILLDHAGARSTTLEFVSDLVASKNIMPQNVSFIIVISAKKFARSLRRSAAISESKYSRKPSRRFGRMIQVVK